MALIRLMVQKSGEHQLRLVVYPIIYKVLYIPGGAGFLPSTVCSYYSYITNKVIYHVVNSKYITILPNDYYLLVYSYPYAPCIYLPTFTINFNHSCSKIFNTWKGPSPNHHFSGANC